jgi:hypothetical protein
MPRRPRQELRCFSLDLQGLLVLGQLVAQALVAPAEPLDLLALRRALGAPDLGGEPLDGPDLTGPAPLDDVARVQALASQQRALGAGVAQLLVLIQDGQLVGSAEPPPEGLAAGSSSGTTPSWARAVRVAVVMVMSTRSCLAMVGWWATAGVSRHADRQGMDHGGPHGRRGGPAVCHRKRHRLSHHRRLCSVGIGSVNGATLVAARNNPGVSSQRRLTRE